MYNLNTGKNDNLLEQCRPLAEYMELINRINRNLKSYKIEKAVNSAVDSCIKDGVLAEFLKKHRAEVLDMCITEFNEKSFVEAVKEEGADKLLIKQIRKKVKAGKDIQTIAAEVEESVETVSSIYDIVREHPEYDVDSIYDELNSKNSK